MLVSRTGFQPAEGVRVCLVLRQGLVRQARQGGGVQEGAGQSTPGEGGVTGGAGEAGGEGGCGRGLVRQARH
jgi:hypothetical protein